jgi:23S rRNA pseudouridine1911/1915/1917 synthase
VYEDEDVIVLNKAPGLSVHPGPGHFSDTLGNFLLHYYDEDGQDCDFHPVHRLDRGTSGLMVAAKHPHAQEVLKNQLHTDSFRRRYLAVCEGELCPSAGVVDAPLGPVEGSLMAQQVRPDGKSARTHYETLGVFCGRSLLRLELETGRTHQIRVHMAHLGHPLTGDFLYGTEDHSLIRRTALHSHRLQFCHPVTGEQLSFERPVPEDMERLLHSK